MDFREVITTARPAYPSVKSGGVWHFPANGSIAFFVCVRRHFSHPCSPHNIGESERQRRQHVRPVWTIPVLTITVLTIGVPNGRVKEQNALILFSNQAAALCVVPFPSCSLRRRSRYWLCLFPAGCGGCWPQRETALLHGARRALH